MSKQLCLIARIEECLENGWFDLAAQVDTLTQTLIDYPQIGAETKSALLHWCSLVDERSSKLPMPEEQVALLNPSMQISNEFGTEI
jgi:hypothetical protein